MTSQLIQIVFILVSIALVLLILFQQSKGGGIGASFGAGASATVFGSRGASSFLYKLTCSLAALFFIVSIALSAVQNRELTASITDKASVVQQLNEDAAKPVDVPGKSADNNAASSSEILAPAEVPAPAEN